MRADELLVETIESLLAKESTPERVNAAEGGIDTQLWVLLEANGLTSVGVSEEQGGSGGSLHDIAAIVRAAGRHSASVPLGDTLVANTFLGAHTIPAGPLALAVVSSEPTTRVPWGGAAAHVVAVSNAGVALHEASSLHQTATGSNYAGEPWTEYESAALRTNAIASDARPEHARGAGALARTMLLVGALEQAVDLSIQYSNEREQFGKQIGKQQVIQHYLSEIAGEAAAAGATLDNAIDVLASGGDRDSHLLAIGAAKAYAGRAVSTINRLAHQIHGAIGFTDEHRLQLTTRRLWAWRDEFGNDTYWATLLGRSFATTGGGQLWNRITAWPPAQG